MKLLGAVIILQAAGIAALIATIYWGPAPLQRIEREVREGVGENWKCHVSCEEKLQVVVEFTDFTEFTDGG